MITQWSVTWVRCSVSWKTISRSIAIRYHALAGMGDILILNGSGMSIVPDSECFVTWYSRVKSGCR